MKIQLLFRNDSLCVFDHEAAEDKRTVKLEDTSVDVDSRRLTITKLFKIS